MKKAKKISFNIIANAVWDHRGLSGGDNIFINFGKYLKKKKIEVNLFTWKHGELMSKKNGLENATIFLSKAGNYEKWPFALLYLIRTWFGVNKVKEIIKKDFFKEKQLIVYSASDFLPDFLPALVFKTLLPESFWVAGFYLFAPNPLKGFRHPEIKESIFWLTQKIIFKIIVKKADLICVTSEPEVIPFIKAGRKKEEIFVVKGGIDYEQLKVFQKPIKKTYEAVFVGRFHPQKGVVEMIDIWQKVVEIKPKAKLAIIGFGSMEKTMRKKMAQYRLEKNIDFLGIMKGEDRNLILQKSKIILHPSIYDSGGMAAATGLACGLPGVSFDLPVFKTYYQKGFLRAETMNFKDFTDKIIQLLDNPDLYKKLRTQAILEAQSWDWSFMIERFLGRCQSLIK